ncbi:nitric oxide reductase activation protein NorD [Aliikangiella sp. IMCC44359]|uniref:nitric oxide reductase activation protein NorD n=1 Tax=Aliikangiella sp. IMCC44359 TaxID=3459125 RepID=UPI00403A98A3
MEEFVGQYWHKYITKVSSIDFPDARVCLDDIRHQIAIQFRAFGGHLALEVKDAVSKNWQGKRRFLSKLASAEQKITLASISDTSLHLPSSIAAFPYKEQNLQTYLWLTALLANCPLNNQTNWLTYQFDTISNVINQYPGLKKTYQQLAHAHLEQRKKLTTIKNKQAEDSLRSVLKNIDQRLPINFNMKTVYPVPIWLDPFTEKSLTTKHSLEQPKDDTQDNSNQSKKLNLRKKGEYTQDIDEKDGLIAFRLESIFSWSEFIPVDRTADEDDEDSASEAAHDIDKISIVRGSETTASKLKFDLDLPNEEQDDITINQGIKLPEWDHRKSTLQKDHCQLHIMQTRKVEKHTFSPLLRQKAKRLKAQFEMLTQQKQWLKGQPDGSEIDLERYVLNQADKLTGLTNENDNLYIELRQNVRSLSCLLLADLSLSTDSYVSNDSKVIDIIKDSLYLFSESLSATQDRFAISGFSSKRRDMVRYYPIKTFEQSQSQSILDNISSLSPGYYTRMGAAIRYASLQLEKEITETKLLLLLSDGKPNDVDIYEGKYGIEDTKQAVRESFKKGIRVFCVTIDDEDNSYLSYIFGMSNFIKIKKAAELPEKLPKLYSLLTN